jgi:DNA mismatch repair protein MutS
MESLSLLHPSGVDPEGACVPIAGQVAEDLLLSRIAEAMSGSGTSPGEILAILQRPSVDPAVIVYRQEVLADFEESPELAAGLAVFLPRVAELVFFTETRRGEVSALRQVLWRLGELDLYVECILSLSSLLTGRVRSSGLRALARLVEERREDPLFENLRRELPGLSEAVRRRSSVTIGVNLDERLRPVEAALLSINDRRIGERSLLARLLGRGGEESLKAIGPMHTNAAPSSVGAPPKAALPLAPLFQDLDGLLQAVSRPIVRAIERYVRVNTAFLAAIAPEVGFYLGGRRLGELVRGAGLPWSRPEVLPGEQRALRMRAYYNLAMALRFKTADGAGDLASRVVANDVVLDGDAGIFVLTGPNRGGKTTYTQGIGIAQALAQAGLCVPAAAAAVSPVDRIVTHFPREEHGDFESGRLGEEASRIATLFSMVTRHSLVLLNESLSSTSPGESLYLAEDILRAFRLVGCRAVFATHLHELATRADAINRETGGASAIVSVVAGAESTQPGAPAPGAAGAPGGRNGEARRTYRIVPGPPAGRSFARDIADRHGISYEKLLATLKARGIV